MYTLGMDDAQTKQGAPKPGIRDPQARKMAIVSAAAEVLTEGGQKALTHRAVARRAGVSLGSTTHYFDNLEDLRQAALGKLATDLESYLDSVENVVDASDRGFDAAIELMHEYLCDREQVRATVALFNAAVTDADLQWVALTWSQGLEKTLSKYVEAHVARALVVYLDGAAIHAAIRGHICSIDELRTTVYALQGRAE